MSEHELLNSILDPPDVPSSARIVFMSLSGLMLLVIIFFSVELVINLLKGTFRRRSNYNFLLFYLAMILLLVCRVGYCLSAKKLIDFPPFFYALWCYYPAMFVVSCSMFFIDSILFSYLDSKGAEFKQKYDWVRLLPIIFMLLNWVCGIGFFCGILYQVHQTDTHKPVSISWSKIYYYYSATAVTLSCVGLIVSTAVTMQALKRFLHYYRTKKLIFYTVIIVMIVELTLRMVHLILAGLILNEWEEECVNENKPDAFIYYAAYITGCDVLPSLAFGIYLHQEIRQRDEVQRESEEGSIQITSVVSMLEAMYSRKADSLNEDGHGKHNKAKLINQEL